MKLTRKQIAAGAVALVVAGAAVVQIVWHPFGRTRALHARQVQLGQRLRRLPLIPGAL